MTLISRIRSKHPKSVCRQANKTTNSRAQQVDASSPSFASRMIQFIFHRKRRIADQRSNCWSGRPVPTTSCHRASVNIAISSGLRCSAPSAVRSSDSVRVQRSQSQGDPDSGYNKAPWRQLQSRCANCERLFFTSLSSLASAAGRFCSLDCKANLEYMNQFQEVMDATWESSDSTCGWTDEDEDEDVERDQHM
ncbi:hypothetical protein DD237_008562 [Peronospora effusa]|uniref:FLZ-type domain-containing protein n=1 Tax=Peronospora effusa TaxID=542832 RepID=A0A3R7XCX9_9STRA|nr:hypothetical protein DD237_008562 [Peronospora effusa]